MLHKTDTAKDDEILTIPPFSPNFPLQEAESLRPGDIIDHRDLAGRFIPASITAKEQDNLRLHYVGWDSKWDTWCSYKKEPARFAKLHSISRRCAHRLSHLKVGDFVDVKIPNTNGWTKGDIRRHDTHSGQVQVMYWHQDRRWHLFWIHLDNTHEIDIYGQHVKHESIDHLQLWLKTRHTLKQSPCDAAFRLDLTKQIIDEVFHGMHNLVPFFIEKGSSHSLQQMQEIIATQTSQYHERQERKKQRRNIKKSHSAIHQSKRVQLVLGLNELSRDLIGYICAYLNRNDLRNFKLVSYRICLSCLHEMQKLNIGVMVANCLLNDTNKEYLDLLGIGWETKAVFERYLASTKYSSLFEKWAQIYDIPRMHQILCNGGKIVDVQQIEHYLMRHHIMRSFLLLDRRQTILFDADKESMPRVIAAHDEIDSADKLLAIKWFDIYFQQLYILQFVVIRNGATVTVDRLLQYMEAAFIATTPMQRKWRQRILAYLKEMHECSRTEQTLIAFQELEASNGTSLVETVDTSNLIEFTHSQLGGVPKLVFQLNPSHPCFSKSKFTSIQDKYALLLR